MSLFVNKNKDGTQFDPTIRRYGIYLPVEGQLAIMWGYLQTQIGIGGYYEVEMGMVVDYPNGGIGFCR